MPGWTLSIDFGTSNTAAAYRQGDGDPAAIRLSEQAEQMPSAVLVTPGDIWVGAKAIRSVRQCPDGFERSPKRLIGQDTVLLGGRDVPVVTLVAAVLRAVAARAFRVGGDDRPDRVLLTHPQDWAQPRCAALRAAAVAAGFADEVIRLVPEPVAAVAHYAHTTPLPNDRAVAVFDFGGGTCDVALLRAESGDGGPRAALRVLASAGADPLGGDVFDHLLLTAVLARLTERGRGDLVKTLSDPANVRAVQALRAEVREAKHELSEHEYAGIPVVAGDDEEVVTITAAEFDELIAPHVRRAIDLTTQTLNRAGLSAPDLHALYLTGGSSYLRAVQRELIALLGRPFATLGDPKLVVALGAHHAVLAAPPAASPAVSRPGPPAASPANRAPKRAAAGAAAPKAVAPASTAVPDEPDGLTAPARRVLTANPALAAALAGTADGPAIIDDVVTLVALMCVPDLVERATAEPELLRRLRRKKAVLDIAKEPTAGVPVPIRTFLGDSAAWTKAFGTAAARRTWDEEHAPGAGWANRMLRTWCTATPGERQQILDSPRWSRWAATEPHYPDGYHGGDPWEPDKICLSPDSVKPTAAGPADRTRPRPLHPSAQQKPYLRDLAEIYAGGPVGAGLDVVAAAVPPDPSQQVLKHLGDLPAVSRTAVEVMGEGMLGFRSELLFYPARADRPPAVVLPLPGQLARHETTAPQWSGFPVIITADVVTSVSMRVSWANAQRRVVLNFTFRPGATCPPSAAELHLRSTRLTELADRIRKHLGRP
jgi:actin-like ATPase involved in cell morphogenesis